MLASLIVAQTTGGVELATIVLAAVGATTGLIALALTHYHFILSGPRISVSANWAARQGPGVLTLGPDLAAAAATLPHLGVFPPVIAITATNEGRSPASITSWGMELWVADYMHPQYPLNRDAPTPTTLEPGGSAHWFLPGDLTTGSFRAALSLPAPPKSRRRPWRRRRRSRKGGIAYVRVGNATTIRARRELLFPDKWDFGLDPDVVLANLEAERLARQLGIDPER